MIEIKYLSPSAVSLFFKDREKYTQRYLCETRPVWNPQSRAMALGSAFDAFVKRDLMFKIYGGEAVAEGKEFHLKTLFDSQVDAGDNRAWAWEHGMYFNECYKTSGAYQKLVDDIGESKPVFEHREFKEVEMPNGVVVPLLGIPDGQYIHRNGERIILDWKCTNFFSEKKISPKKNYVMDYSSNKCHKKVKVINNGGFEVQDTFCLSETDKGWARQVATYHWLLGGEIGEPVVGQIDQLMGMGNNGVDKPDVRVVTFKSHITPEFQFEVAQQYADAWTAIKEGNIFDGLGEEETNKKISTLNKKNLFFAQKNNPILDIINKQKGPSNGRYF